MTNSLKPSDPGRKERISRKAAKEKHFVGSASHRGLKVFRNRMTTVKIGFFFLCVFAPLREVFGSPWANSSSR